MYYMQNAYPVSYFIIQLKLWVLSMKFYKQVAFNEINPFPMNAITNKRAKYLAKLKVEFTESEKRRIERVESQTITRCSDRYLSDEES